MLDFVSFASFPEIIRTISLHAQFVILLASGLAQLIALLRLKGVLN